MNFCRKCQSDYEKPGTCNCFAPHPARTEPLPMYVPFHVPVPTPVPTYVPNPMPTVTPWDVTTTHGGLNYVYLQISGNASELRDAIAAMPMGTVLNQS